MWYWDGSGRLLGLLTLPGFPEASLELNWIDLPELQESEGQLDQHVARTRLSYCFTPRTFLSGLIQYNSSSETFGTNLRLRW